MTESALETLISKYIQRADITCITMIHIIILQGKLNFVIEVFNFGIHETHKQVRTNIERHPTLLIDTIDFNPLREI